MDVNYYQTLIAVADDCPVTASEVPRPRAGKKTVAVLQYEMLAGEPYVHTSEDVLFTSWLARQDLADPSEDEIARLRHEFFSRPQACLRASPLPKKHGFGLAFDDQGRVALVPMESEEYQNLLTSPTHKITKAMRSRRA
ncbi:DUF6157 family protein [Sphaerisporangium melleum]|uniref:DUF6157 family protein n=1 Tax=Sphaerisporangium melleum TaxID=321316 RepID=UPI00166E0FC3|nr:DUF6157 family protein [Sphaerisporangium melleum]